MHTWVPELPDRCMSAASGSLKGVPVVVEAGGAAGVGAGAAECDAMFLDIVARNFLTVGRGPSRGMS